MGKILSRAIFKAISRIRGLIYGLLYGVLTSHAEVIANRRVLEVEVPGRALVPAGMLAPYRCEVEESIARLRHLQ